MAGGNTGLFEIKSEIHFRAILIIVTLLEVANMFAFEAGRSPLQALVLSGALATSLLAGGAMSAQAADVIITVERVEALDQVDPAGRADLYARVTIDGEVFKAGPVRGAGNVVTPNWVFTKRTDKRSVDVKLEIVDRDTFGPDDIIDINRVDGKRDLDFRVRTRPCDVIGFSGGAGCRESITREGRERKKARVTFRVDSRR